MKGDTFEVIGAWKVAVHDNTRVYQPWEKPYYVLSVGDVYNMKTRKIEKFGIGAAPPPPGATRTSRQTSAGATRRQAGRGDRLRPLPCGERRRADERLDARRGGALAGTARAARPRVVRRPDTVFFEDLTFEEIREAIAAGTTNVIIATGGVER